MNAFESELQRLASNPELFESLAFQVFEWQAKSNPVYARFLELTNRAGQKPESLAEIPFLPISFFKSQKVVSGNWTPEAMFKSSGTTGQKRSTNYIASLKGYHELAKSIFEHKFGPLSQYKILALLPNYQANPHSSLISMVEAFGRLSGNGVDFYGLNFEKLAQDIEAHKKSGSSQKLLLFSVSFALEQMAMSQPLDLSALLVIETGGMKGLKTEGSKEQFLNLISQKLKIAELYSEYGMTELQSQAYADPLLFTTPYSMKVMARSLDDPFAVASSGRGCANVIDLGNYTTCSFIATDDLVEIDAEGRFQLMGRLQGADLRGCNLLFS